VLILAAKVLFQLSSMERGSMRFCYTRRFAIACNVHAILALSLNLLRKGDRAHYGEEETHKEASHKEEQE
jgi:hypothetical protein